ncbi:fumarylacetoacetate hydrolase family protein [Ferrovibrio sp.]|uniref:fumarylacetoacetate hydrolase family protein n=1 Tax=Ferrovibrio sp. TaxID=1917215 RepID=UPI00261C1C3D|nr:fumarylacetoacetate hydrolase family protein [Ferrovibrio sp.]
MHGEAIARLLAARKGGPLYAPDYELAGLDDVWTIQSGVMAALGPVGGWKVGRSAPDQPAIRAPIRAGMIRPSPAIWQPSETRLRGAELEIAFRINAPLPPADAPDFLSRLAKAVTPLPAFEVIDSRLGDPRTASRLWILADFQMNAGLVPGAPFEGDWQPEDFDHVSARLEADGEVICDGPATMPGGSPFALLAELARSCGDHCGGLQPGQIVTTGSFTGLRFFKAGTTLTGTIAGMAPISATFAV